GGRRSGPGRHGRTRGVHTADSTCRPLLRWRPQWRMLRPRTRPPSRSTRRPLRRTKTTPKAPAAAAPDRPPQEGVPSQVLDHLRGIDQSVAAGDPRQRDVVLDPELGEQTRLVRVDGLGTEAEAARDLFLAQAL